MYYMLWFMFLLNVLLILFRLKKVLMIFFAMELMTVNLLFFFVYMSTPFDPMSLLVFLAVAAGEASMGLSLMVAMLRQMGNDNMLVS